MPVPGNRPLLAACIAALNPYVVPDTLYCVRQHSETIQWYEGVAAAYLVALQVGSECLEYRHAADERLCHSLERPGMCDSDYTGL